MVEKEKLPYSEAFLKQKDAALLELQPKKAHLNEQDAAQVQHITHCHDLLLILPIENKATTTILSHI